MKNLQNIIVTGSNKGIGYGIVQGLASNPAFNIIMACRDVQKAQVSRNELLSRFPKANIAVEQLDITDRDSINNFINVVNQKYEKIDIVVNNAAIAAKGDAFDEQIARWTFSTNFYGTINFTDAILKHVSDAGKIIFVGSVSGKITKLSEKLKEQFRKPNMNRAQIYALMDDFLSGVHEGNYASKGWPRSAYGVSKIGINHFASVLSRQKIVVDRGIQVYALCPGYVNTDMSSGKGPLTIQQGAQTPLFLINLPHKVNPDYQGRFFQKCKVSSLE